MGIIVLPALGKVLMVLAEQILVILFLAIIMQDLAEMGVVQEDYAGPYFI